jgi:hypothetical protein
MESKDEGALLGVFCSVIDDNDGRRSVLLLIVDR